MGKAWQSLLRLDVIGKEALHTGSHFQRRMSSRPVPSCTGRISDQKTRQRLEMEIVCSSPTMLGPSPPPSIFTPFSKL
ncbi:unnamed protein product [Strongylus vulgaris]|uniref:Uncharacterized protein n=1 Tax=Strongylus vulgaris TaxID=40348 RepID=A0A3P7IJP6_STRVU|nr:unnamed protein product [Strongylus vulgaris]